MTTATQIPERPTIDYPDSDGLPMADNMLQYEWIVTIKGAWSRSNQLANRLVLVEQGHRPAAAVGNGGAGVDAEVVVQRGEDILE